MSILSKGRIGLFVEPTSKIYEVLPALALYRVGALLDMNDGVVVYRDLVRQWLVGVSDAGEFPYPAWYKTISWSAGLPKLVDDWRKIFAPVTLSSNRVLELLGEIGRCGKCEVYLVGGAVRELVRRGLLPEELDVVLGCWNRGIRRCLKRIGVTEVSSYPLSIKARYGRYIFDFTYTRYDYYPKPGKMPIVVNADVLSDLERRDFTNSAVALMVYPKLGWVDPFNGLASLAEGVLKLIRGYGFMEDPARIVRMVKYIMKCGFKADEYTEKQAVSTLGNLEGYISRRLWLEIRDLYCASGMDGVSFLGMYGFWEAVLGVSVNDVLRVISFDEWSGLLKLAWRIYEKRGYSPNMLASVFKGLTRGC